MITGKALIMKKCSVYHYVYQSIREAIFCPTYLYDFGIDVMAEIVGSC